MGAPRSVRRGGGTGASARGRRAGGLVPVEMRSMGRCSFSGVSGAISSRIAERRDFLKKGDISPSSAHSAQSTSVAGDSVSNQVPDALQLRSAAVHVEDPTAGSINSSSMLMFL